MESRLRRSLFVAASLAVAFVLCARPAFAAVPACAPYGSPGQFVDPAQTICHISGSWIDTGKTYALELLGLLLVIEFSFIGIRYALFKVEPSALIGATAYRVVLSSLTVFLILNADTLFEGVVRGFESSAWSITGTNASTADVVAGSYGATASGLAIVVGKIHQDDMNRTLPPPPVGNGGNSFIVAPPPFPNLMSGPVLSGTAISNAHLHDFEIQLLYFFVMLLFACAATVLITYVLFTAESYIVVFGGIVFLGFSGSSFTESFSTGYMKFAIFNGARLFFFYLVLALEQTLLPNILSQVAASAIVTGTSSSSNTPGTSVAAEAALGVIGFAMLQVAVLTTLVCFIPNFVAGALFGTSSSNASAFLKAIGSAAGQMQQGVASLTKSMKGASGQDS